MPARRSASLLIHAQWWSEACSTTGRSGTAASSQAASKRPRGASAGSYGPPSTHSSSGCSAAYRRTSAATASTEVRSRTAGPASSTPPQSGCTCPSPNPGSTAPASTISVAPSASSSASVSSATTRPSRTATARASGRCGSPVRTAPRRTRSAPPTLTSSEPDRSGLDVGHHVLDPGVVLEAVHRQVLAVAGVLEAAVRHLGDQRDVGVDPHAAEVQALGHPHRPAVVPGPDRGRQAVLHPVGPAGRLVLLGEPLHGDDRPEDLVLHHLVVLGEAGHDGGLVEVAAGQVPLDPVAAGRDLRVLRRPLEEAHHPVELVLVVQGAEEHVLVVGEPGLGAVLRLLGERGHEVVVDAGTGEHPGGGGAVLAGVEVAGHRDGLGGRLEVGVVEDDDRRLAAELEVHLL